jgi:hypothetical protein
VPGEDEQTVRWLTGGYGTVESTAGYFDRLARNAVAERGKRGFGVCPQARGGGRGSPADLPFVGANQSGTRAAIRVEPENEASVRVARKCGFSYVRDFVSTTDTHYDLTPVTLSLYLLEL